MKLVDKEILLAELKEISKTMPDGLVKGVVDVEKEIMVVGADLYSDGECLLLQNGSKQEKVWGITIYPTESKDENLIALCSAINFRPSLENESYTVKNPKLQEKIAKVFKKLVKE